MKKVYYSTLILSTLFLASCKKDEVDTAKPLAKDKEYVGLLVGDVETNTLTYIDMYSLKTEKFEASYSAGTIYESIGKRFAFINHSSNNKIDVFDRGLENHGDHYDQFTRKMLDKTIDVSTPIHFHSSHKESVFFNDNDGSITIIPENEIGKSSFQAKKISLVAKHHGAAVPLANGNIVVTDQDLSVNGAIPSLPQKVIVVDANGVLKYSPSIRVGGMHGSTSFKNGEIAAFGTTAGILFIGEDGKEQLVKNNQILTNAKKWLGSLQSHDKLNFVYAAASGNGIYKVDPIADTITNLLLADNVLTYLIDEKCENLIVALKSGKIILYDAMTGAIKVEKSNAFDMVTNDEGHGKYHPSVATSAKYIYISNPNTGDVLYYNKTDLGFAGKISVGGKPTKLVVF